MSYPVHPSTALNPQYFDEGHPVALVYADHHMMGFIARHGKLESVHITDPATKREYQMYTERRISPIRSTLKLSGSTEEVDWLAFNLAPTEELTTMTREERRQLEKLLKSWRAPAEHFYMFELFIDRMITNVNIGASEFSLVPTDEQQEAPTRICEWIGWTWQAVNKLHHQDFHAVANTLACCLDGDHKIDHWGRAFMFQQPLLQQNHPLLWRLMKPLITHGLRSQVRAQLREYGWPIS